MLTLIKNGEVFAPDYLGKKDILLVDRKIGFIQDEIKIPVDFVEVQVIDATGKKIVPGIHRFPRPSHRRRRGRRVPHTDAGNPADTGYDCGDNDAGRSAWHGWDDTDDAEPDCQGACA